MLAMTNNVRMNRWCIIRGGKVFEKWSHRKRYTIVSIFCWQRNDGRYTSSLPLHLDAIRLSQFTDWLSISDDSVWLFCTQCWQSDIFMFSSYYSVTIAIYDQQPWFAFSREWLMAGEVHNFHSFTICFINRDQYRLNTPYISCGPRRHLLWHGLTRNRWP